MCTREIKQLIHEDRYWGEFPETVMDEVLALGDKDFEAARTRIRNLGREEFVFGRIRSDFLYYLDLDKESVVLDCGSGLGVHAFNAARMAKEVHAFDQSYKRLQFTAQRKEAEGVSNIFLYHSDFKHLPFQEGTFDAILMNGVVEWLGEIHAHESPREDQIAVLRQMHRLLKPGGRLYIGIENRWAAAYLRGYDHNGIRFTNYMPRALANIVTLRKRGKPYRTYTYGRHGYQKLLEESGFPGAHTFFAIAYPSYNEPRYIIPFDDLVAISFFLKNFAGKKGWYGRISSWFARVPFSLKLFRHFFWSFAMIATKDHHVS